MNRTRPTALAQAARRLPLLLCAGLLPAVASAGPLSITDVTAGYTQNFDGLASTSPLGFNAFSNGNTLQGWYLVTGTSLTTSTTYRVDNGNSTGNSVFSYGSTGSSDRALGARPLASSNATFSAIFALAMTNDTGADIASFDLNYDGEQWLNGGQSRSTAVTVGYRKGATYASTGWTNAGTAFNFTSPIVNNTAGALDGNAAANRRADRGGTVSTTWAAGETLWLRFAIQPAGLGGDNGLAIDNLSLSFTPATIDPPGNDVPEPGTLALVAAGLAAAFARSRR